MLISTRGRASDLTQSSVDSWPLIGPSEPCSSMNRCMRLAVRLWTATGMSWWATFRARLAPIVARPVRPKWVSAEEEVMSVKLAPSPESSGGRRAGEQHDHAVDAGHRPGAGTKRLGAQRGRHREVA